VSEYEETMESLSRRLARLLAIKNEKTGYTSGFIGLVVRDLSIGNIDIIHNCKHKKDIIKILKITIKQLKKH